VEWSAGGGSESLAPINNYSSTDTAESSTAVQQYSGTAVQHQQDSRTAGFTRHTPSGGRRI